MKNYEHMHDFIKRNFKAYLIAVALICLCEVLFALRLVILADLSKLRNLIYFLCYTILAIISLGVVIFAITKKSFLFESKKDLTLLTNFYSISLLVWAFFISANDILRGNYPIVFITLLFATSALGIIIPYVYTALTFIETVLILIAHTLTNGFDDGFFVNFAVLYVTTIFVCFRSDRLNKENYKNAKILQNLSFTDQLTNVFNRRALDEKTKSLADENKEFTIVMGDIDCFKQINDVNGHHFGDDCIKLIAGQLKKSFNNLVYRYGGDEFAIISYLTVDEICDILQPFINGFNCNGIKVFMSFGVTSYTKNTEVSKVFEKADQLLYKAKNSGKAIIITE